MYIFSQENKEKYQNSIEWEEAKWKKIKVQQQFIMDDDVDHDAELGGKLTFWFGLTSLRISS